MTDTQVEAEVRRVLADQAERLIPPDLKPGDVTTQARLCSVESDPGRQSRLLWVAAAVVLVVGFAGAVVLSQDRDQTRSTISAAGENETTTPESPQQSTPAEGSQVPVAQAFEFETPQVRLRAAAVTVHVGGQTFVPSVAVEVDGDPGTQERTTLELTWFEHDIQMRIYIYFTSDGTDWWANEISTYDGAENGEWITTEGEFFRSPLGQPFIGDVALGYVNLEGVELEAFRARDVCDDPQAPVALVADQYAIAGEYAPGYGYATSLTVLDTASCQPIDGSGLSIDVVSGDPDIASIQGDAADLRGIAQGKIRVELRFHGVGKTSIRVQAHDKETGELVGAVEIPVSVEQSGDVTEAEPTD